MNTLKQQLPFIKKAFVFLLGSWIFVSALKMYVVVYVLFYTLPDKIQNAKFWLRGIYFLLFYVFCCLTYFWI